MARWVAAVLVLVVAGFMLGEIAATRPKRGAPVGPPGKASAEGVDDRRSFEVAADDEASNPVPRPSLAVAPPIAVAAAMPAFAPRSLRDTEVDGAFETDAAGCFVPSASAVRLFDYFLSAEGEVPVREIRTAIRQRAEHALPPEQAERAMELFDRYVDYRPRAAAALTGVGAGDRREALAATHAARRDAFGNEDAQRMFGEEESIATVALNEADIARSDLPEEERAQQLAVQEGALPARLREIHARRARDSKVLAAIAAEK
jgi:lipase chaperone LimK